jgi:N-acylglucosamine 2-epimerase
MISTPGFLAQKYTSAFQVQGHSITMILLNTASRIRLAITSDELTKQIDHSIGLLRSHFMHPEFKALLETVGPDGQFIDTIIGRVINPGHCIETAWFILQEAEYREWDAQLTKMGLTILDWSWKWGWDEQYGGIVNFCDCRHLPCQDYSQDMKFWWPHTEAIIACLYAYLASGDDKYLAMHRQVSEWTYGHFPDREHGEWFGYLHRDGTVAQPAKGNLFKGPFHIPRMMIQGMILCRDILNKRILLTN